MASETTCRHCGKTRAKHFPDNVGQDRCHVDPSWSDPKFEPGPTYAALVEQVRVLREALEPFAKLMPARGASLRIDAEKARLALAATEAKGEK